MSWQVQNLVNQAYSLMERENFDGAIECFRQAIVRNPGSSDLYAYLGEAYYFRREYEKAMESFAERDRLLLESHPLTPYIEGYRGCIQLERGESERAAAALRKSVRDGVKDPEIHYRLATLQMQEKKMSEARKTFQHIERLDPSFVYKKIRRLMNELREVCREKSKSGDFDSEAH